MMVHSLITEKEEFYKKAISLLEPIDAKALKMDIEEELKKSEKLVDELESLNTMEMV